MATFSPGTDASETRASDDFMKMVQEKMHPGMTVVLTDAPLHPDTRTGKDFVIMS